MTTYDESNFFDGTAAIFDLCETPSTEPDYVSASGSKYWYVNGGVVRSSDHWGDGIASCSWYIRELDMHFHANLCADGLYDALGEYEVSAFCKFGGFRDRAEVSARYWEIKREIAFKANRLF